MTAMTKIRDTNQAFVRELSGSLGSSVKSDEATLAYYSNDVFWQPGIRPLAVVTPKTVDEAQRAVKLAAASGIAVVPRGGGISFTKGYLPALEAAIVIDCRGLNRVIEVNVDDMYIVAESGCTWEQVNAALEGTGLRTGYWGPFSGVKATVGGALSQNSMMYGAAKYGAVIETVLNVNVILPNGSLVTTGSGGRNGTKPFSRTGGPDLTGIFLGDNGAMGLKVSASLRLHPVPAEIEFLSFGFKTIEDMCGAHVQLARKRLISEGFGIDRNKALNSASVNRISDGIKALGNVAKAGKSLLGGLKDAAAVAAGGSAFLRDHNYTLHVVIEARDKSELGISLAEARSIGNRDGVEILNTVPKVMRAKPFSPVRGMLGPDGERWVPIHALFPMGDWQKVVRANEAFFAERRAFMDQHKIVYSVMVCTVGNEFFFEPAFYWPDEITPLHAESVGHDVVKPWIGNPANEAARAAVARLRRETQELYANLGGVSYQVARDYPFKSILKPASWSLLESVKNAVDPRGLMNPGSLGLNPPA